MDQSKVLLLCRVGTRVGNIRCDQNALCLERRVRVLNFTLKFNVSDKIITVLRIKLLQI